jgi:tetratricopeptide (TPR) repeat protein
VKNGKIIFLEVPKSLGEEMASEGYAAHISIDPSIPLPVEVDAETSISDPEHRKKLAENLSWEMIISGMIQVVSQGSKIGDVPMADTSSTGDVKPHWIDYYRQFVLTLKPEIYNDFTGAALIKSANGDFDEALEIIAALEGLFPFSAAVLGNKAFILEEKAADLEKNSQEIEASVENDKAREAYQKALSLGPVLPELLYNAGYFFMRRKNFAEAMEHFDSFLSLTEDDEKKERIVTIIKEIKNQGLDDHRLHEALELIRKGKEEDALLQIRDFLEEHPKVWNGWFTLGWALRKLGRWQNALESFKKTAELGGANPDTRNETAICLMELGELDKARKELETALHDDPENVKIISNLGVLSLKVGKKDEAAGFFRTVLELNPHDPLAAKYLIG